MAPPSDRRPCASGAEANIRPARILCLQFVYVRNTSATRTVVRLERRPSAELAHAQPSRRHIPLHPGPPSRRRPGPDDAAPGLGRDAVLGARDQRLAQGRPHRRHLLGEVLPGGAEERAGGPPRLLQRHRRDPGRDAERAPEPREDGNGRAARRGPPGHPLARTRPATSPARRRTSRRARSTARRSTTSARRRPIRCRSRCSCSRASAPSCS